MTKYFKFVGVILIILFLVAAILEIVVFVETVDYLEGASLAISIVEIALFLIIGPASGMLFISYANHKEEHDFKDDFDEGKEEHDEDEEDEEDDYVENTSTPKKSISELPVAAKYDIEDIEIDGPIIKLGSRSFRMTLISDVHLRKDNIDLIAFGVRYKIYFDNEKRGYSLYQTILDNYRQI